MKNNLVKIANEVQVIVNGNIVRKSISMDNGLQKTVDYMQTVAVKLGGVTNVVPIMGTYCNGK